MKLLTFRPAQLGICSRLVLSVVAVLGLPDPAAFAFENCQVRLLGRNLGTVEVKRQQAVDRISARDLYGTEANSAVRQSRKRRSRVRRQSSGVLTRRMPSLWWTKLPRNVDPASLIVSHQARVNGAPVRSMVRQGEPEDRLPIVVHPERPISVCRNASHQIVEGGVTLEIDVQQIPSAGRYHVLIETRVERR